MKVIDQLYDGIILLIDEHGGTMCPSLPFAEFNTLASHLIFRIIIRIRKPLFS